jgi:hypothetical protein
MRTRVSAAILALASGLTLAGCGSGAMQSSTSTQSPFPVSSNSPPPLTWNTSGNLLVPFCTPTATPSNCLSDYNIRDTNTGATVTVAITATSYDPPIPTDSYQIRVNGFDGDGDPISSPYAAFPPPQ